MAVEQLSDASDSVKQDKDLSNQRFVRYEDIETHAYLHVKTTPYIYFAVVEYRDDYAVLLGPIVDHLDTAKF